MEIVDTELPRSVSLTANFNGLDGTSAYDLSPAGSGSKVTWSFSYATGSSPFKRWQGLMLDRFIGAEYSAGLERLKAKVETDRRPTAGRVVVPPQAIPAPQTGEPTAGAAGESVVPQTPPQGAQQAAPADTPQAAPADGTPPPPPRRQ